MKTNKLRYSSFVDAIDVDAFEQAIDFEPDEERNGEDIGQCPDLWGLHNHGDTTGKFAINREKRLYHCFVCGGGSLLSFAMEFLECEEEEAIEWLHQFATGDVRTDAEFVDYFMGMLDAYKNQSAEKMPFFNEHVLTRFHQTPWPEWFEDRGISREIYEHRKLGYNEHVMKPAPIKGGEKIVEDYFGPCVVFPHFWEGRLVGWQHRWLDHGQKHVPKWLGKYTNTSDFPKGVTLYNYDVAFLKQEPVVVVESVPTVLMLESFGVTAVSSFGAGIKEEQLRLLRRFQHGVILAPDNDKPGREFVKKASEYLQRYIDVKILPPVELKEGADLGDYINCENTYTKIHKHLEQAESPDILGL